MPIYPFVRDCGKQPGGTPGQTASAAAGIVIRPPATAVSGLYLIRFSHSSLTSGYDQQLPALQVEDEAALRRCGVDGIVVLTPAAFVALKEFGQAERFVDPIL